MEKLFLPTLHWFAMTNPFSGSSGDFRFMIKPNVTMKTPKEVDFEACSLHCEYWHGPFCYEKSDMEADMDFPMTEEGREEMCSWLMDHI